MDFDKGTRFNVLGKIYDEVKYVIGLSKSGERALVCYTQDFRNVDFVAVLAIDRNGKVWAPFSCQFDISELTPQDWSMCNHFLESNN